MPLGGNLLARHAQPLDYDGYEGRHARRDSGARARHARTVPGGRRRHGRRNEGGSFLFEMTILIPATVMLAVLVKTFVGQIFYVPSGSMAPTIIGAEDGGDRVVVNKLTAHMGHKPQRGEIVVFRDKLGWLDSDDGLEGSRGESADSVPVSMAKSALTFIGLLPSNSEKDLIKRVIGVGGDEVSCFRGKIFVNGTQLREDYVFPGNAPCGKQFNVRVPFGRIFVMGDHREASADSTAHLREAFSGTVAEKDVIGPAYAVVLPFDRMKRFEIPGTFGG